MWEVVPSAPLPMYATYRRDKRKQSKPDNSDKGSTKSTPAPPPSSSSNVAPDFLEPALDGPPSPERLRQLSRQARGAGAEKSHQQQPSSSTSSLRSLTSLDRPSWEQTLESISLSRRSSSRSTTSSMPSKERPDSVQIFGKAIFGRRGKGKRESKSSSGSSLHSGEPEAQQPPASKDYFIPITLRRRRAATATAKEAPEETAAAQQKRFQISGPYNFQHVTHASRDTAPEIQVPPGAEALQRGDDMNFSNFSSEAVHLNGQRDAAGGNRIRVPPRPLTLRSQTTSPPRRLIKRTQSQEQMRIPPPRPPRSPPLVDPPVPSPPVPPPRISSRAMQYRDFDPLMERPATEIGFRQPQPFSPQYEFPETDQCVVTPEFNQTASGMDEYFDPRFSHAITTPDDAAWPMTSSGTLSFENTLPEVPEEEENNYTTRSRLSMGSASSSLRASQSVPALRITANRQSNASETLGRFDEFAIQMRKAAEVRGEPLARETWEDCIDYCYDHAAEADFDYEWERPSLDGTRDVLTTKPSQESKQQQDESSPYLTTPSRFDVPELSPASQTSNAERDEVLTPLIPQAPSSASSNNFSLPRKEGQQPQQLQGQQLGQRSGKPDRNVPHIRTPSHASSFKESHGFTLSPSLLIPNDYHEQMLLAQTESNFYSEGDEDEDSWVESLKVPHAPTTFLAEPPTSASTLNPDLLRAQLRGSVSSIGTQSSGNSGPSSETSTSERHISTTSTSTAYSRFTVSSNPDEQEPLPTKADLHALIKGALSDAMDSSDNISTVGELPPTIPPRREHSRNRSVPLNPAVETHHHKRAESASPKETAKPRRQRSKTTSSVNGGTPTYGLFPSANLPGNRI